MNTFTSTLIVSRCDRLIVCITLYPVTLLGTLGRNNKKNGAYHVLSIISDQILTKAVCDVKELCFVQSFNQRY